MGPGSDGPPIKRGARERRVEVAVGVGVDLSARKARLRSWNGS